MPEAVYTVAQALLSWLVVAVLASLLASLTYPLFRGALARADGAQRAMAQFAYGALGPVAATLSVVLIMHPEWAAMLVPEHCHGERCDPHRPEVSLAHPAGAAMVAGCFALVLFGVVRIHSTIQRARGRLQALRMLSESPAEDPGHAVVENPQPLAWCTGLLTPRVYVSSGLLAQLSGEELSAVLAHEHAHARRRDNLRRFLLGCLTLSWPRKRRRLLMGDLAMSIEEACDREASASVGGSAVLIRLLDRLRPASGSVQAEQQVTFQGRDIEARIKALERPPSESAAVAWLLLAALWLLCMVLFTGISHLLIERLVLS